MDLLGQLSPTVFPFDRRRKLRSCWNLFAQIYRDRPDVVVMEGSGLAGGIALMLARLLFGQKYVVSSGDAIGPWFGTRSLFLAPLFGLYERCLCRLAAGFIGWTPYLVGRALTFGAPRAMTAPGWAPFQSSPETQAKDRLETRRQLAIPIDNLVIGIAGSMAWSSRYQYCYGLELVEAAHLTQRTDVTFLLVGDGTGLDRLRQRADSLPPGKVVFTGRVPQSELPKYYAAMDLGSLPQSVDAVGSFRYTTKVSEYLAFRLPLVISRIPMAYDFDAPWIFRLPGDAPWKREYFTGLASLLDHLSNEELQARRESFPASIPEFDPTRQTARTAAFVRELVQGAFK